MATYPATIVRYRHTAGLLGIFGGTLGLHNFYLGKRDLAIIQLLITILGSFLFGLGAIVTFIWGIVEGVQILTRQVTLDGDGQPIADPDFNQVNGKSKILAGILESFWVPMAYTIFTSDILPRQSPSFSSRLWAVSSESVRNRRRMGRYRRRPDSVRFD
jgi:hypothetical protein